MKRGEKDRKRERQRGREREKERERERESNSTHVSVLYTLFTRFIFTWYKFFFHYLHLYTHYYLPGPGTLPLEGFKFELTAGSTNFRSFGL